LVEASYFHEEKTDEKKLTSITEKIQTKDPNLTITFILIGFLKRLEFEMWSK